MITIGIDPGTATTGFSIVEKNHKGEIKLLDYGCIKTSAGLPMSIRLNQIAKDLKTLIKKWKPNHSSIEKLFFNKNVKTAITVAQARGVILQTLEENHIGQDEYTPLEVKSAVCGHGKADKKMVQEMIKIILGLSKVPKPDDAADAIALALCSINSLKIHKNK
jgi:crossover junction endodeoxyribonuclease RuvC